MFEFFKEVFTLSMANLRSAQRNQCAVIALVSQRPPFCPCGVMGGHSLDSFISQNIAKQTVKGQVFAHTFELQRLVK